MLTAAAALLGTPFCFGKIACCNPLQLVNTQTDHWALEQSILYASAPNVCLKGWGNALEHQNFLWMTTGNGLSLEPRVSAVCLGWWVQLAAWAVQTYLSQFWTRWLRYWEEARGWGCKTHLRSWLNPRVVTHLALGTATATCTHPVTSRFSAPLLGLAAAQSMGRRNRGVLQKSSALASSLSKRHCSTCVHLRGSGADVRAVGVFWPQEAPCSPNCACAGPQPQAGRLGLKVIQGCPCFHWGSQADKGEELMIFSKHGGGGDAV